MASMDGEAGCRLKYRSSLARVLQTRVKTAKIREAQ